MTSRLTNTITDILWANFVSTTINNKAKGSSGPPGGPIANPPMTWASDDSSNSYINLRLRRQEDSFMFGLEENVWDFLFLKVMFLKLEYDHMFSGG